MSSVRDGHLTPQELKLVLESVRRGGARSRTELMRATGLGRAVVAVRVSELIDLGLVNETGGLVPSGGRPARNLEFCEGAGHLLVADMGATSIDAALTNLGGKVLSRKSEDCDISAGPEAVLSRVESLFDDLEERSGLGCASRWGIGVSVPGPVEFSSGCPIAPPIMPGWDGYPIRSRLVDRYGVPVWVDNDANVMAFGEWRQGAAQGHDNVIYVKVGTGVGAGLISRGALHRGQTGSAGDVGHIQVVTDDAETCRCGNSGCLEAAASGGALARQGLALAAGGESPRLTRRLERTGAISARDVCEAALHGDQRCVELVQRTGRLLGVMLASITNFFNPSLIVIGGGLASMGDLFLASMRETLYRRSLPLATRDLVVRLGVLGDRAGIIGLAELVSDELFSGAYLADWIENRRRGHAAAGGL